MRLGRAHVTVFVATAALVWLAVLLIQGTEVTWEHGRPFSIVVGVLVALGTALEHFLWRVRPVQGVLVKRPDLRGTWRVGLQSSYVAPETREPLPLIVCYMGVKQTLSTLQMHLMTSESESWFITDHVRLSRNGVGFQVIAVYENEPKIHLRAMGKSEMHLGAIMIETHGKARRPTSLSAKYWTDRGTTGTMELASRLDEVFTKFDDAHAKFLEGAGCGTPGRAPRSGDTTADERA